MFGAEQFAKIVAWDRFVRWACLEEERRNGLLDYFDGDAPLFGRVFGGANSSPPVPPARSSDESDSASGVNGQQPKYTPFKGTLIPMRVDEN